MISDNTIWSFSRLNKYETCPYAFYQTYILGDRGESNFYAESGLAMHKTLEKLIKGEIKLDSAAEFFDSQWDNITADIPDTIRDKIYEQSINYLTSLTGDELNDYEVLLVEQMTRFNIGDYKFQGAIDLLIKDKSGGIIVVDHKSHKKLLGKNGKPLKAEEKTLRDYKRQMYFYCEIIKNMFGSYPTKLVWNHFKTGDLTVVPYNESEHKEAIQWALETIEKIEHDETFENKEDFFYCHRICDYRNSCEYLEDDE